jgi:hypothetical protein
MDIYSSHSLDASSAIFCTLPSQRDFRLIVSAAYIPITNLLPPYIYNKGIPNAILTN